MGDITHVSITHAFESLTTTFTIQHTKARLKRLAHGCILAEEVFLRDFNYSRLLFTTKILRRDWEILCIPGLPGRHQDWLARVRSTSFLVGESGERRMVDLQCYKYDKEHFTWVFDDEARFDKATRQVWHSVVHDFSCGTPPFSTFHCPLKPQSPLNLPPQRFLKFPRIKTRQRQGEACTFPDLSMVDRYPLYASPTFFGLQNTTWLEQQMNASHWRSKIFFAPLSKRKRSRLSPSPRKSLKPKT